MKITIQELSKSFGGRDIFNNFSLEVDSGVRLCVCGPNGTGKSTLLRLLAGVEPADGGRVILPKGCRLGFVEQELSEEALDTPLLTYVLDVLHDWNEFWAEWEEAAQQKDEARLTQLMHRQAELEATHGYNPEHRAKAVLSGTVPVVGGIISQASGSVLAGAGLLKNSLGVLGLLAVLATCLTPFLRMAVQYLLYKVTAFLAATAGNGTLVELIDALGSAFGLVLGMVGSCALLLLISITSSVSVVIP